MVSEGAVEAALVDWINSFPIDTEVSALNELNDGTVICKILLDIDKNKFETDLNKITASPQWIVRFQNLKKIYKAIGQFYTASLDLRLPSSPDYVPNLSEIARDGNRTELTKLVKIVLVAAIQSEHKEDYIFKIRELSPSSQTELMLIINEMMELEDQDRVEDATFDSTLPQISDTFQMEEEIAKLLVDKEATEIELTRLKERHSRLQRDHEDLQMELHDNQGRTRTPGKGDTSQGLRADAAIKSRMEQLQADIHKLEDIVSEKENSISSQETTIKTLTRKVDELQKNTDLVEKLKDELDASKHTIEGYKKEHNVMQHYRRKLESMPELERKVKNLEEENISMSKEAASMEENLRQAAADKKLVLAYKKQIEEFQQEHAELLREKQRLEMEQSSLQDKLVGAETQRVKDTEVIQTQESRIRDFETGVLSATGSTVENDLESEITFNTMSKSDLKLQISKLQRELQGIKGEGGEAATDNLVLKSLLDDKDRAYKKMEQDYVRAHGDKLALEATLNSKGDAGESSQIVAQLQQNLDDRDRIVEEVRAQLEDSEAKYKKRLGIRPGDDLAGGIDEMDMNDAEDLEEYRSQTNKLLLEKDELQKRNAEIKDSLLELEKLNGELKTSIATFGGTAIGREGELEKRVLQLQEKLEDRREKMTKSREHIKKQNITIKELEEQLKLAKAAVTDDTIKAYEEQNEERRRGYEQQMETLMHENALMTSAWYDISSRLQINTVSLSRRREEPYSWLGKQRNALTKSIV